MVFEEGAGTISFVLHVITAVWLLSAESIILFCFAVLCSTLSTLTVRVRLYFFFNLQIEKEIKPHTNCQS